jgi:hypothetical protein
VSVLGILSAETKTMTPRRHGLGKTGHGWLPPHQTGGGGSVWLRMTSGALPARPVALSLATLHPTSARPERVRLRGEGTCSIAAYDIRPLASLHF